MPASVRKQALTVLSCPNPLRSLSPPPPPPRELLLKKHTTHCTVTPKPTKDPSSCCCAAQEKFNETPTEASNSESIPSYLQGKAADTPVMMYCTGGIRCDVYSAHLRDQGFTNLFTLEGGIHNYFREEGHQLWDGSLFVFDGRMAVPSGDDAPQGGSVTHTSPKFNATA